MNSPFSFFGGPIWNRVPSRTVTIKDIHSIVTSDELESISRDVLADIKLKVNLPFMTSSALFSSNSDYVYVNKLTVDWDHLTDKYHLNLDDVKHTLLSDSLNFSLLFSSPSHTGLKGIITINGAKEEEHDLYFRAAQHHLKQKWDLEIDPACRNISRACFLATDKKAVLTEGSIDREVLLGYLPDCRDARTGRLQTAQDDQDARVGRLYDHTLGDRPSDRLNRLPEIHDRAVSALLEHGWKQKGELCYRPGKEFRDGNSASYRLYQGIWIFYCFSSNPLVYPFQANKGYNDCQILSLLRYGGDWAATISDLARHYLS